MTPGVQLEAGSVDPLRGRRRAERRRRDPRRLRRLPRRPGRRRSSGHRRRGDRRPGPATSTDLGASPWSRTAGGHRAVPASTCRPSGRGSRRRPSEDLVLAETMAAAGVEFIAVSFVRAAADMTAVRERRRRSGPARRQDRDERGAREPHRDPRRVRCDHGRPGRPRDRLPARGRAAPAEARSCGSASSSASR